MGSAIDDCNATVDELNEEIANYGGGRTCSCGEHFPSVGAWAKHVGVSKNMREHLLKATAPGGCSSTPDPINHPAHYTFGEIEVIDAIEDWGLSFHQAQVLKYVVRSKHKGKELEDLKKAKFYLDRLILQVEGK